MAEELWIFGYGSLIWRPGFDFTESHIAVVRGYHRALCVYSHVHRGTRDQPGLVLGLKRGGSCKGVVFKIAPENADATLAYLRAREQVTDVYLELTLRATLVDPLADGRVVKCICYVADQKHEQFASALERADLLRLVKQGVGVSGANPEYVRNTHDHLRELGIRDATLEWLLERLD